MVMKIPLEKCERCGDEIEPEDYAVHAYVRHTKSHMFVDEEVRKMYYKKYPHHRYNRKEWGDYLRDRFPVIASVLNEMSQDELGKLCNLIAKDDADKIRTDARERADELKSKITSNKVKKRWWPWS